MLIQQALISAVQYFLQFDNVIRAIALLSGEMSEVLAVLQQGLDSAPHQEFCQRLAD